ncbi:hypothetical protein, partial [Bifidobacterium sp.]|uniref:hypothetical protein n=1 Tax=Bifidobacterium sp. TaxID=41200 RepID=UPI003D7E3F31
MRRFWKVAGALAVAACTMFAGAATANAADVTYVNNPTTLSNVRVSDVGAHTANVLFDYSIDPAQVSQIKDVCFSIEVQRITDITPIQSAAMNHVGQGAFYSVNCDADSIVSDGELTAGSYDAIYGVHNDVEYKGAFHDSDATHSNWWEDPNELTFKASGQHFYRFGTGVWNGKASGSFDFPLIGLTSNTAYTNNAKACKPSASFQCEFGDSLIIDQEAIQQTENVLWNKGVRVKTPVDVRQVILYAQPIYKDPNTKVSNWSDDNFLKQVPDFTTKAEPAATSAELLPSETETKLSVAGGKVQPGQTARVYVDNLKA